MRCLFFRPVKDHGIIWHGVRGRMSAKVCRRCGYVGGSSRNLRRHLERARPCEAVVEDVARDVLLAEAETEAPQARFACKSCEKVYSHASGLSRHRKQCTGSKAETHAGGGRESKTALDTGSNTTPMRAFCHENLDYLVRNVQLMQDVLMCPGNTIVNIVREIHFNQEHPEHMNVYIDAENEDHGYVYNGEEFVEWPFSEISDMMLVRVRAVVQRFFDYVDDQEEMEFDEEARIEIEQKLDKVDQTYKEVHQMSKCLTVECTRLCRLIRGHPKTTEAV